MTRHDPELEQLRAEVNCATLLERLPPPWRLDRKESTKNCLKYRRGEGEILIVNHAGRGWWDPGSDAKGDVFSLVQHLDPGLNFGEVRKVLRPFACVSPTFPDAHRRHSKARQEIEVLVADRWARRPLLRHKSPAWRYLALERGLPTNVLEAARSADVLREGPYGSAWFAHRADAGAVTHIEIRGPGYKGSLKGGAKILFRLQASQAPPLRLVLAEAPIDALSVAALENIRTDTLYAATGGGMGPATLQAIEQILARMAPVRGNPETVFCSGTDSNSPGERYAAQHQALAAKAGVAFERLRPPIENGDWNDILKQQPQQRTKP